MTATNFSELALDPDDVRADLVSLGIDDSLYSDDELRSLMTVSDVVLQFAIEGKASDVEELLLDFQLQSDKLNGLNEVFAYLVDQISPEDATVTELMNFLNYEQTVIATGNTADLDLDYTLSGTGFSGTQTYNTILDYLTAVENNSSTGVTDGVSDELLYAEYQNAVNNGLFDDIYDSNGAGGYTFDDFLAGNAYLGIAQSDADAPITVLHLQGFKDYLIASAVQAAGFIGDDVYLDPILFADADEQVNLTGNQAAEWITWHQLFYGKTSIEYDVGGEALTVAYNGAAALRDMGLDPSDYFEDAYLTYTVTYDAGAGTMTSTDAYYNLNWQIPSPFDDEAFTAFLMLTATNVYGDFEGFVSVSDSSFGEHIPLGTVESYSVSDSLWTEMSGNDLTFSDYLLGDNVVSLLEDVAGGVESQAATAELALLESSTALTEWSELHGGWDTVHKYVTDAIARALRFLK